MRAALLLLVACSVPRLEDAGQVAEDGSCSVLVLPGDCADAADLQRQFEAELPCNVCVSYRCACQRRTFCKICGLGPGDQIPADRWGCTTTGPAWCWEM